jgi:MauM/NapG family ferredoxin protein
MAEKKRTSWIVWLRRLVQTGFFLLFCYLFLQTVYHPINKAGRGVTLFFNLDPLVALSSWLASHALVGAMLLSLVTLAVTFICGRWFCGWVCPFGTVNNFFTSLRGGRAKQKLEAGGYHPWQKAKYYALVAFLVAALLGANVVGWLDPFSFFFRSLSTSIYPVINKVLVAVFTWIYDANPGVGPVRLTLLTEPIYGFLRKHFLAVEQPYYWGSLLIGALFIAVVALNFWRPRFWCRYVCPLGALLGVVGKNPLVRLKKDAEKCDSCRLCLVDCQGGATPDNPLEWKPSECFYCWDCKSDCPAQAISFTCQPTRGGSATDPWRKWIGDFLHPPKEARLDLGRRGVMAAGLAGVGAKLLFAIAPQASKRYFNPALIRPPGALPEDEFLARCIRCGECMKVCPTNAVHPASLEGGVESAWTPLLNMSLGYCDYECNLCSQVCPTHAIRQIEVPEKQKIKIGLAYIDRNRCLPWAYAKTCIVCEEHCPTPKKAIWFEEVEVRNIQGEKLMVKQPRVDPELCIGCGICETKCPVKAPAAVRVTSVGETRNPENQILLSPGGSLGLS